MIWGLFDHGTLLRQKTSSTIPGAMQCGPFWKICVCQTTQKWADFYLPIHFARRGIIKIKIKKIIACVKAFECAYAK